MVSDAFAQRPVRTFDPFYLGETAEREYFDAYALSAEVSYFPTAFLAVEDDTNGNLPATTDPLGLNFRLRYHLSPELDLGVYVDASGTTASRSVDLAWIALKYFQRYEYVNYAVRLAVDPALSGGGGFPQMALGEYGFLNPMLAGVAMALSSVTVMTNSLRLRALRVTPEG